MNWTITNDRIDIFEKYAPHYSLSIVHVPENRFIGLLDLVVTSAAVAPFASWTPQKKKDAWPEYLNRISF